METMKDIVLAENEFIWNDFPGHKGRKGIGRGGSLPRGGSGGFSGKDNLTIIEMDAIHARLRERANWTKEEIATVTPYFGIADYRDVQNYFRGGDDVTVGNGKKASEVAELLDKKTKENTLDEDLVLYRALAIRNDRIALNEGNNFSSTVLQSASLSDINAMNVVMGYMADEMFSEFNSIALLKIKAHKGARGVASYTKGEYEIVLPRDAQFKIVSKKDYISHIEYEVEYE